MTNSVLQNTCYLLFFTLCIDKGDGRWKEKGRNNLRHDIDLYKRMAEKIEREIYAFYGEYPGGALEGDNVDVTQYKYVKNPLKNFKTKMTDEHNRQNINNSSIRIKLKITNDLTSKGTNLDVPTMKVSDKKITSKWPKFEEILLEMGKKYDWKNDRWIKVKEKMKSNKFHTSNDRKKTKVNNMIDYHENHKFSYKFVKLNTRSKNRRSIVVAVSAIR